MAILLFLLKRFFGIDLSKDDLQGIIDFIKMLIGAFKGKEAAMFHVKKMAQLGKRAQNIEDMRRVFEQAEVTAKQVVQG